MMKYNLDMLDVMDDKKKFLNFLRMEKWIADRPHHPGEAAKQWLKDLYQDNKLVRSEFVLGGRKVELKNITAPVLNVFAKDDHIIPPATSQALRGDRHRRLHRARAARRPCRRVRRRQVAGPPRLGDRALARRTAIGV
jgi:poly(3-hydroxyalkanoate) synthetase